MPSSENLSALSLPSQFLRFGIVGTIGFIADASMLTFLLSVTGLGFYLGRLVSFLFAASITWALNRYYTFRDRSKRGRMRQWGRFVLVNTGGGLVNYGVYSALILGDDLFRDWPVLAVAAGSIAGLMVNFLGSKFLVFHKVS
jgi:putative flippase GtrA